MFLMVNDGHLVKVNDLIEIKKNDFEEVDYKSDGNDYTFYRPETHQIFFKYSIDGKAIENTINWYNAVGKGERDIVFDEINKELNKV